MHLTAISYLMLIAELVFTSVTDRQQTDGRQHIANVNMSMFTFAKHYIQRRFFALENNVNSIKRIRMV